MVLIFPENFRGTLENRKSLASNLPRLQYEITLIINNFINLTQDSCHIVCLIIELSPY